MLTPMSKEKILCILNQSKIGTIVLLLNLKFKHYWIKVYLGTS